MKKFDGVYLFSDVDGTFATVAQGIPKENMEAVEYFVENGGTFGVATGRYKGDLDILDGVPINGLSILNNGACIYDFSKDSIVYSKPLPDGIFDAAINFCKENPSVGLVTVNDEGYINTIIDDNTRMVFNNRYKALSIDELKPPFYKFLFAIEPDRMKEMKSMLLQLNLDGVDFVQTGRNSVEIVPKGISKGKAFLKLCEDNNININRTFFVGDSFNDITIMQNAGFSGCISTAEQEVKQHANKVLCSFEEGIIKSIVKEIENSLAII